jgi:hypothetical protein
MPGRRRSLTLALTVLLLVLMQVLSSPAGAVPLPGPGRALWGGTSHLQARESSLGRPVDIVRVYSQWHTGPPTVDSAALRPLTAEGRRTLLYSSTINWGAWRDEARRLNGDGNPANDVPEPYCKTRPVAPGTTQPSGRTWFGAIGAGHYDAPLRRWLEQLAGLASSNPALYVSFHHEAERLSDGANSAYQRCLGTPAEYRTAWQRLRRVAEGTVGAAKPNLLRRAGGPLVLVSVHTNWGFWHTANAPGTPARALVNPTTGQPVPGQSPDDQNLRNARVTLWAPAAADYDVLATDVYNYSASLGPNPREVAVDDPATAVRESDQWLSLSVLLQPFMRWATNWAARPGGSVRPLMLAEYGSVPDPTRPARRPAWLGDACRFLSAPAQARFHGALYFDVAQWSLRTWQWQKLANGRWSAVGSATGTDTRSVAAMAGIGRSTRFGGSSPCP